MEGSESKEELRTNDYRPGAVGGPAVGYGRGWEEFDGSDGIAETNLS